MGVIDTVELSRRLRLDQGERVMRKLIGESDIPFLGLLGEAFNENLRQLVAQSISSNPTVKGYIRQMELYPALFTINLAWHVMLGMGQTGIFSLYPYVVKVLHLKHDLSPSEREALWSALRHAVVKLGLEPSPRTFGSHYMADEYLRQAGVPLAFADDLADRMLRFARKVGLPDSDDPEGLLSWQFALDEKLGPPFSSTARNAFALDRQGYYTLLFLRVYEADGQVSAYASQIEQAMARAFKQEGAGTRAFRRAVLPRLQFHDASIGVFFPGGDERDWELTVDGVIQIHRSGAEDQFIPLRGALPLEVRVRDKIDGQSIRQVLWEDSKANRLLVFAEGGRFLGRSQLAPADAKHDVLALPPGAYTVLSRFIPSGVDAEEIGDDPALFTFTFSLRPGESTIFRNGPAQLVIQAESLPMASWRGETYATREGVEFFHGDFELALEIPRDWLSAGDNANYVLRLMPGSAGEQIDIPLELNESGLANISVFQYAMNAGWKPGLIRVLAELRRNGETRVLLRSVTLFWFGLKRISTGLRFECDVMPSNIEMQLCENVELKANGYSTKDLTARTLRFVFSLNDKRRQTLTWNVPGVFIEVEDHSEGGAAFRMHRFLGSTEVVSLTSAKQILISATDPGILQLGDWSQHVDFARRPTRVLSAAFLASRVTPDSSNLMYINDRTGNELELLKLTQPHEVSNLRSQLQAEQFVIWMNSSAELAELSVRAVEVLSGEEDIFTLSANTGEWVNSRFGKSRLMVEKISLNSFKAYIYVNLDYWPEGGWIFEFNGRVGGVWGRLENERQDIYAAGMLLGRDFHAMSNNDWSARIEELSDNVAIKVLQRVHQSLLVCYPEDSWKSLNWLSLAWQTLIKRFSGFEVKVLTELVDLAVMHPSDESSVSWIPQFGIADALPGIFALPNREYRRVNEKPHPFSLTLKAMAEMDLTWPTVFPDLIHPSVATAFSNVMSMMRGAQPSGFDLVRYSQAISQVDSVEYIYQLGDDAYLPKPGDYLGPLHYRNALRNLKLTYERTLSGNERNRGFALKLAKYAKRVQPVLDGVHTPKGLLGLAPHIEPWLITNSDEFISDDDSQLRENLSNLAHLLALLAFSCRLEVRMPGYLASFVAQLALSGIPMNGPLAFLLQIGEGTFAYYLLLWELALKADEKL
jgi:hypothetical protein